MLKNLLLILFLVINFNFSKKIYLNLFYQPKFLTEDVEILNLKDFLIHSQYNGVIKNLYCGQLFDKQENNKYSYTFLKNLAVDYLFPLDFSFSTKYFGNKFSFLAANIKSNKITNLKEYVVFGYKDFKVGLFTLYSIDYNIKYNVSKYANFDYEIFDKAKSIYNLFLENKVDFIVILSDIPIFVLKDILEDFIELDLIVFCLDYGKIEDFNRDKQNFFFFKEKNLLYSLVLTKKDNNLKFKLEKKVESVNSKI